LAEEPVLKQSGAGADATKCWNTCELQKTLKVKVVKCPFLIGSLIITLLVYSVLIYSIVVNCCIDFKLQPL
jgi:hypothetical protein